MKWIMLAAVGMGGCERSGGAKQTAVPRDAAGDSADDEPRDPPPPPTVKAGGKGDCQVAYAPRPTRDPNPMCKIDGGTFLMGAADDEPGAWTSEKPQRRVTVSPFYLDQFEVTNAQVLHFLRARGHNWCGERRRPSYDDCFTLRNRSGDSVVIEEGGEYRMVRDEHLREPFFFAQRKGAEAYCAWAGKRLPTEAEWEFAARHDPKTGRDLKYPWGDEFRKNHAACDEEACADGFVEVLGEDGSLKTPYAPVGTFDGTQGRGDGASPWGVHDLAGNSMEMMADAFLAPYPDCGECIDPIVTFAQIGRPSSYVAVRTFSSVNPSLTQRSGLDYGGFRCASGVATSFSRQ